MLVHVIPAPGTGGQRHQETFPSEWLDEQVIAALTEPRPVPGRPPMPPIQNGYGRLKVSDEPNHPGALYLDHPKTAVVVGRAEGKKFIEERRIRG